MIKNLMFNRIAAIFAVIGFTAANGVCLHWYYKPEIPEELKEK